MNTAQSDQKDLRVIIENLTYNNSRLASNVVKLGTMLREIKSMPDEKLAEIGDTPKYNAEDFVSKSLVELRGIEESIRTFERLLDHLDTVI